MLLGCFVNGELNRRRQSSGWVNDVLVDRAALGRLIFICRRACHFLSGCYCHPLPTTTSFLPDTAGSTLTLLSKYFLVPAYKAVVVVKRWLGLCEAHSMCYNSACWLTMALECPCVHDPFLQKPSSQMKTSVCPLHMAAASSTLCFLTIFLWFLFKYCQHILLEQ